MKRTILYLPFIVILSLFATACGATPTPETIVETAVSEVIETPTAEHPRRNQPLRPQQSQPLHPQRNQPLHPQKKHLPKKWDRQTNRRW
jgi:hypothetical protein